MTVPDGLEPFDSSDESSSGGKADGGESFALPPLDSFDDLPLPNVDSKNSESENTGELPALDDPMPPLNSDEVESTVVDDDESVDDVSDESEESEEDSEELIDAADFLRDLSESVESVDPDEPEVVSNESEVAPEEDISDDDALAAIFNAKEANGGTLSSARGGVDDPSEDQFDIDAVLRHAIDFGASDVHIEPGDYVAFTRLGEIVRQKEYGFITGAITEAVQDHILTHVLEADFVEALELDTSYVLRGAGNRDYENRRFRVSVGRTFGDVFFVFRVIADNIPTPEELGVNDTLRSWSYLPNGLVMMNGPTGTGKALGLSTCIPTPTGIMTMGDLRIGSKVYDSKRRVVTVTGLSPIDEKPELYRICLSDGQKIIADVNHQWIVSTHSSRSSVRSNAFAEIEERKKVMHDLADAIDELKPIDDLMSAQTLYSMISKLEGFDKGYPRVDSLQRVFRLMDTPYELRQYGRKLYDSRAALNDLSNRLRQRFEYADTSPLQVLTTGEMLEAGLDTKYSGSNFGIPVVKPEMGGDDVELPIDPYVLGMWLGDGSSDRGSIAVGYSDLDATLKNLSSTWHGDIETVESERAIEVKLIDHEEPFRKVLRATELYLNKHIPAVYFRASYAQRLALLQGLMDSDGCSSERDRTAGLGFTNERLANDSLRLARSLGIKTSMCVKPSGYRDDSGDYVECKTAYCFDFVSSEEVFKLERKQKNMLGDRRPVNEWIYVRSIERIAETDPDYEPVRCISVDSEDHSYLCADHVVTHNSTTLASLLNAAIKERAQKIITIERPVEYVFHGESLGYVTQREVGQDTRSFEKALDSAMRQAPDVIMIGESRNRQEIDQVLRAAETGHLAMTTMHTNSAAATVNRIKTLFDGIEQQRVLSTLADVSRGFANQVLVKTIDGESRFAIREILEFNDEVSDLVSAGDIKGIRRYQIENHMTMEDGLVKAVVDGRCTLEAARAQSAYPLVFDKMLKEMG